MKTMMTGSGSASLSSSSSSSSSTTAASSVRFLPALLFHVLVFSSISAMAVDRSKFRTCEQTSFCRRHRGKSTPTATSPMSSYKVLYDSWKFHPVVAAPPTEETDKIKEEALPPVVDGGGGGVWSSLQRRLLGNTGTSGGSASKASHEKITPTLTGRLQSPQRSSQKDDDYNFLDLSITALQNDMIRVQITEVVTEQNQNQQPPPRVTYDHLVLQQNTPILHAHFVEWLQHPNTSHSTSNDKNHQLFIQVLKQRKIPESEYQSYTALIYGDDDTTTADRKNENHMFLLIQMEPFFMLSLYRTSNIMIGPIMEVNADQLMHTEIRRSKKRNDNDEDTKTNTEPPRTTDEAANADPVSHGDKEIVGYWEDGLAIYADGTREEKKKVDEGNEPEEEHQFRRLTESKNDNEDGMWEETFGSHVDSKPYGPMSVGIDISFPHSQHVYGLPEHASSAVLQTTTTDDKGSSSYYKEPYRLYNLDVFEYELDETMALYGAVPLMISQSMTTGTSGVFYFNPTETFIDISRSETKATTTTKTHWISESGILDLFLLPGPDPHTFYQQYSILTGVTPLPPMFSLGYHQCRWNYKDEKDVATVHAKFEELDYPYDVLWLDIEHTDGKRYFTWDKNLFPTPTVMQQNLANHGRYMVTIIDPHMKRDDNYYIHKEATAKGLYIKDKDGEKDYDGWCWPGSSSYLDFTAEHVRSWWADQFHYNKYIGSTSTLFTWNDMNEPSVFNGPEVSMQKDLRNLNGEEHREWHNLYGMLFHRATGEGQIRRNQPDMDIRPFVLSRSFFAGSQRYGSIWTGDNAAEWSHLQIAAPMLLSLNTAALSFVGADVGGFFGNPEAELFTRWMQAGAYQPFFRGHAHHDSKRREPWMFGEETLVRLRNAAMKRYALLPYWYTMFYEAEITGMPVMRMMWMEYPKTEAMFGLDDQYLIGADLLVKPITAENTDEAEVMFPTDHLWYDVETMQQVFSSTRIKVNDVVLEQVSANIDTIPVYQRGGSILPRKLRLRRSSTMMKTDPYTLYIALDNTNQASGKLHMDDEISFGYKKRGEYADANFSAKLSLNGKISNSVVVGPGWTNRSKTSITQLAQERMIERIIVMGLNSEPSKLVVDDEENRNLDFSYDKTTKLLVIRKPELSAVNEWSISYIV